MSTKYPLGADLVTVRVLNAEDVNAYRALRLEGLRESPTAFGASHDDEASLALDDQIRRVQPTESSWLLGAQHEQKRLVGCIGWYRDRGAKVRHKSHVWGMYVTPSHRRMGVGRQLVADLVERAKTKAGVTQIELFVAAGNVAASALYQRVGFKRVATHPSSLFVEGRYIDEELMILRLE